MTALKNREDLISPFLVGEKVYLRPMEKEDLAYMQKWSNDPETRSLIGECLPMGVEQNEKWFEKVDNDESRIWFSLVLKEGNRVVGEAGLLRMFHPWRGTDLTLIIGEKDVRGKGYGAEAMRLLLDYAFGYLNFHRVAIGVVGFNEKALRFYEKVGFKKEGIQRDGYYFNHRYHDFVMMCILEDEYREMYGIKTG